MTDGRRVIYCEQGTEEWAAIRCGRVTASSIDRLLTGGSMAKGYMLELLAERLTGQPRRGFKSAAMDWGTEKEPQSRAVYEMRTGLEVQQVGCVLFGQDLACSPDGLVGKKGSIESKSPDTKTHLNTLLTGKVPRQYRAQIQAVMWIAQREWCDFISFDPRLDDEGQMITVRVERDQAFIDTMSEKVADFVEKLHAAEEKLSIPRISVDLPAMLGRTPEDPEIPELRGPDVEAVSDDDRASTKAAILRAIDDGDYTATEVDALSRELFFGPWPELPLHLMRKLLARLVSDA